MSSGSGISIECWVDAETARVCVLVTEREKTRKNVFVTEKLIVIMKENESVCVKKIKNERASSMCKRKRLKINRKG